MKKITVGLLAHVDAGKTTLSEGMLYASGHLRKLGRVDKQDTFLDTDNLEKKRGITIFSHTARLHQDNTEITMVDTPGHIDFASQTEQVLSVLDYAILLVSASDGVTNYTKMLWDKLREYEVPTFVFINKMDSVGADKAKILTELNQKLNSNFIGFEEENDTFFENIATSDEQLLNKYLDTGQITDEDIVSVIRQRKVFPVYFGSALKMEGIKEFLTGLDKWTEEVNHFSKLGLKIFKISHDQKIERLTWAKVTGGFLKAKSELVPNEKINEIRIYNGNKYEVVDQVNSGTIVALTGLSSTYAGQGLGVEKDDDKSKLMPVLRYRVVSKNDIKDVLEALRILEDEDASLHVQWSEHLQELSVELMGEIQKEILISLLEENFNIQASLEQGSILYKETITDLIEGVGHFEPLRHYAETHLLMEPLPVGSGLVFENQCSLEVLDKNWQHQIMTSLKSKEHVGVLTGMPITDMKITLIGGKASNVHTVGGDFREATYRALRQGLMELREQGSCQLLEPWYDFNLTIPQDQVGRAINDIQQMAGNFELPSQMSEVVTISGQAPVAEMQGYANKVRAYTRGEGQLECIVSGYLPCHDAEKIVKDVEYDPISDLKNTPNSVFCYHGAGHTVTWDKVPDHAHFPYLTSY
ncbi:TetM/TetW/TetO/TetS family tetracycline resistance ribosomal protection protein [Lactobacillus sp.]|uniref:GTP-binding protein n=1 Tax=Lactobacillus sp. TaxID=1591 RepID=UPI0019AFD8D9|nr:TetM/TetW/TetO/TetS family tetracycline resistance ribosomal protection protein [Lactobacillus sp.]MBD5430545.1 TetM/TetW/TetO/TetS family tetracycline resistance ribosomal protection protein [Lactobacillus sp.]